MYNKSFLNNVQLTLNDEIIDITSVSSVMNR